MKNHFNITALVESNIKIQIWYFRVVFPQTWSEFIACIKSFTSNCLSSNQRSEFNRAVGDSINSVHKMCTNDDYKSGEKLSFLKRAYLVHVRFGGGKHYKESITLNSQVELSRLCLILDFFKLQKSYHKKMYLAPISIQDKH